MTCYRKGARGRFEKYMCGEDRNIHFIAFLRGVAVCAFLLLLELGVIFLYNKGGL